MIVYKSSEQIELIRESALLVSKTLGELKKYIFPGAIPIELDKIAETFIRDHGAEPGFLGMYDFPNSLCISINEEVVHGIPNNKPLKNGDIVSIDCGVLKNDYYGDHAYTFSVGEVDEKIIKLLEVLSIENKAKIVDLSICEQVYKFINENLSENLRYIEKKNKIKINLKADNILIIPDYKIEFKNKSKKIINKVEEISELKYVEEKRDNVINFSQKKNKISFKKSKFKKNYKKKYYKKKIK